MRKSQAIFFGCLILLLAACGGGGGAKVELVPVATELRPTPNGYAFANFPASASPEEFDADDLAKMFGSEACVDGVVAPCDPIAEAAAWARMVNQARASGQCEGMVVEASQRFDLSLSPPTVDLVNEGEVTHEIIRTFATQFLPEVQEETLGWGEKSLGAIVAELVESFKTGKAKYSMGLYIEQGGHALLPYAVEFPTPDLAVIQLYDSNWPGKNRYVEVDLKAKQWRFSFSGEDPANDPGAWTGGQGFMDLTSLDTRGNSTCPFCASKSKVKNSMIVISSVDTDWSISNANGTYSPSTNNSVEGIVSRPIRGSVSPNSVKVLEPLVGLSTRMRIAGYGGLILALLVLLWLLWRFIVPALSKKEKRYTILFIVFSVVLFVLGCSIAYWTLSKAPPNSSKAEPNSAKALEYVVFVEGNDMKLDLPNRTSAFISQGTAVVQVSTSGKNSGTVTITKDTVSVDDPNVNVKVASADLVADVAGNNTVIAITEKQLDVSVESSTGQTFTVAVNQETPQVSARAVDPVGSSAPTNFVITTQTSDNQVQVREVARDGSETVVTKQATALTDLNSTKIELAPVLQVSTVKPGLPPLEDRDLKNPEYKADESFVPQTGLVVSKLAEVVVLNVPTTVPIKNVSSPEVMNSFGPTTLVPVSTTTVPPTTVPPSSTTTTPTTLPTTTTVKPTTTTVKPVVRTTTTTTTTVPPTTTTSSTTTTTSSTTTTTTTSTTTTTVAPPPPDTTTTTTSTTTTTTSSTTTTTTIAATAPGAPTSVTGTSGNAQVSLSWYAPSSNGGAAVTDYVVQYSTSASSGFETFSDGTSTATTATVTGLTNGTVYYFKVAAVNSVGTSSYSTVSASVTPAITAPAFTLSSSSESKAQNVAIAGYTISSTGGAIASYAISTSAPAGTSFSTSTGLLSGTPTTVQSATVYTITATNATSTATQTFTLTVTLAAPAFTLSSSSESKAQNTAISGYTISSTGGLIASYAISPSAPAGTSFSTSTGLLSGTPTAVQSATVYTITATNATGSATQTFTLTVTLSCANGGVCAVGDTGAGGGVVFYVQASGGTFTSTGSECNTTGVGDISTCKYLEAAPSGWIVALTPAGQTNCATAGTSTVDPKCVWSGNTSSSIGSTAQGTAIGTGHANTTAIILQNNTAGKAATVSRAYQGGGKTDWFLPSQLELNQLCRYAWNLAVNNAAETCTGGSGTIRLGLSTHYFWSSSETSSSYAHLQSFLVQAYSGPSAKSLDSIDVRPVRAGGTPAAAPSAPTGVSITASSGSLSVAFTAGATGGSAITSYKYSTDGGTTFYTRASGTTASPLVISTLSTNGSTALTNGTAYSIQIKAVNLIGDGTATASTSATPASCANGGACVVGVDTGAGGGIVFYYSATAFTSTGSACNTAGVGGISTCKYLEAAPSGWIVSASPASQTNCITAGTSTDDPRCAWSGNTTIEIGSAAQGTAIGTGHANTTAIIAQTNGGSTTGKAATVSRAYQGGGKTDWFLPSQLELNQLCRYAWNLTVNNAAETCTGVTGTIRTGFSLIDYWSSSEYDASLTRYHYFRTGGQANYAKNLVLYVRPVRAG